MIPTIARRKAVELLRRPSVRIVALHIRQSSQLIYEAGAGNAQFLTTDQPASKLVCEVHLNATQRLKLLVPSSSQMRCNPNQTAAQKQQRCWLRYGLDTYPTTLPTL